MSARLLINRCIHLFALCVVVSACGGGGGSSSSGVAAQSVSLPPATTDGGADTSGGSDTDGGGTGGDTGEAPADSAPETDPGTGTDADTDPQATSRQAEAPAATTPVAEPAPADDPAVDTPVINLLALVTPGAAARYPEDPALRVEHMVAVANLALEDSGLTVRFALAGVRELANDVASDSETALRTVTAADSGELADLGTWRRDTDADLVVLFRAYGNDGVCGLAWIGGTGVEFAASAAPAHGTSTVAIDCSDLTLVHELGHNLGLAHSRTENPDGGHTPWAAGHGVDGVFATIMASPTTFDAPQLTRFSDPDADCLGHPCGVDASDSANGANAVAVLRATLPWIEGFSERL